MDVTLALDLHEEEDLNAEVPQDQVGSRRAADLMGISFFGCALSCPLHQESCERAARSLCSSACTLSMALTALPVTCIPGWLSLGPRAAGSH